MRALVPPGAKAVFAEFPSIAGLDVREWDGNGDAPGGGAGVVYWATTSFSYHAPFWNDAIAQLPDLRYIQLAGAGYEHVPPLPESVTLCNAHGVHDAAVAEWVVGWLLATWRRVPDYLRAQARGESAKLRSEDVTGKRILIYGYGGIGQAVEQRLRPFDVEFVRVARRARKGVLDPYSIEPVLSSVDAVVLIVPLTEETRGLVDARFLAQLRDGCVVVNAARGPVVDLEALLDEVKAGRLRAVLDVTDPEPLPPGHPAFALDGVLLTSRTAASTDSTLSRMFTLFAQQFERIASGAEPINAV